MRVVGSEEEACVRSVDPRSDGNRLWQEEGKLANIC